MATRLYVGNLPFSADNAQLMQMFGAFGEVVDAHLVMDRESGQSKGFAFVEMGSEEAMRAAIAGLNGSTLDNRVLTVNEARPRPERDRRGR